MIANREYFIMSTWHLCLLPATPSPLECTSVDSLSLDELQLLEVEVIVNDLTFSLDLDSKPGGCLDLVDQVDRAAKRRDRDPIHPENPIFLPETCDVHGLSESIFATQRSLIVSRSVAIVGFK